MGNENLNHSSLRRQAVLPYYSNSLFYRAPRQKSDGSVAPQNFNRHQFEIPEVSTLEEFVKEFGMFDVVSGNRFNTREAIQSVKNIVSKAQTEGTPIDLVCIVCPPYKKERLGYRKNIGLFTSVEVDPVSHNFAYDYKGQLANFLQTADFFRTLGVSVRKNVVVGDWSLRDLEGINQGLKKESDVFNALDSFKQSLVAYSEKNGSGFNVVGFREIGVDKDLPFGMPQSPQDKRDFMEDLFLQKTGVDSQFDPLIDRLREVNQLAKSMGFETFLDWKNFESLNGKSKNKEFLTRFCQMYRNTAQSRNTERGDSHTAMNPLEGGFYDALMKTYESYVYAARIKKAFPFEITTSFDTKFTAAGLIYQEAGLNVLYLDPVNFES